MKKKVNSLIALLLAAVMICAVLPMGVMADGSYGVIEQLGVILCYEGFDPANGIYSLEDDVDYVYSIRTISIEDVLVGSDNVYSISEYFENLISRLCGLKYGYKLVGWRLWGFPIDLTAPAALAADDDAPVLPDPVLIDEQLDLGFTYDFGSMGNILPILEPVFERYIIDPQPQDTDPDGKDYFSVGVKYYELDLPDEFAEYDDETGETTTEEPQWTLVSADDGNSLVDVEYQWYLCEEEEYSRVIDEESIWHSYWCVYDPESGVWCSESNEYYGGYQVVSLDFEVKKGESIRYVVTEGEAEVYLAGILSPKGFVSEEIDDVDSWVAETDVLVGFDLISEAPFEVKITAEGTNAYKAVEGRNEKCLLDCEEGAPELETGEYICRVSIMADRFEPYYSPQALELSEYSEDEGTADENENEPIAVLESNVVKYVKPEPQPEPDPEPDPDPEEKKSVFNEWMNMFFYMKETCKVNAFSNEGGVIETEYLPTGSIRIDIRCEIDADEGYEIADVIVDGVSVGAVDEYIFENVSMPHTIEAVFTEIQ